MFPQQSLPMVPKASPPVFTQLLLSFVPFDWSQSKSEQDINIHVHVINTIRWHFDATAHFIVSKP